MFAAVNFHYIRHHFDYAYPSIFGVTPTQFERQVLKLGKYVNFVSQTAIRQHIKGREALPEKAVLITLDDGLKEQFQLALPILRKHKIPAVFFISTIAITEKRVLNVHKIHLVRSKVAPKDMLHHLKQFVEKEVQTIDFERALEKGKLHYRYDTGQAAQLKYALNFMLTKKQQSDFIDELFLEIFGAVEEQIAEELYMNEEEIFELGQSAFVGSHAHQHNPVGLLTKTEQHFEAKQSKAILERISAQEIFGFSYPYGSFEACNGMAKVLESEGYSYALTMQRALNKDFSTPYYLSRFANNDLPLGKSYKFENDRFFEHYSTGSWEF